MGALDPRVSTTMESMFRKRRPAGADGSSKNPYEAMRAMALAAVEHGLPSPTGSHPDVSGVVIDVPAQGGFATFVGLTDNTTSMYTSTGGGTIGAGEHDSVAQTTQALLVTAQSHLAAFTAPDDAHFPLMEWCDSTYSAKRVRDPQMFPRTASGVRRPTS